METFKQILIAFIFSTILGLGLVVIIAFTLITLTKETKPIQETPKYIIHNNDTLWMKINVKIDTTFCKLKPDFKQ